MYLFGLEGSGFVISLGLSLLIVGAIMFYIIKRFAILESYINEQGKILHAFINRMQKQELASTNHLASSAAIHSANEQQSVMSNDARENSNKIDVSDNDESNSETSSESGSDDDNDDNDDNDDDNDDNDDNNDNDDNDDVKNIIHKLENVDNIDDSVKIISIEDLQPDLGITEVLNLNDSDSESNLDSSTNLDTNSVCDINNLDVEHLDDEVKGEIKKGGITKMKVSELRDLVIEYGLVNSVDDANKLKKDNLIKLLQQN